MNDDRPDENEQASVTPPEQPPATDEPAAGASIDIRDLVGEARYEGVARANRTPPLRRVDVIVLLILLVATGVSRLARLSEPGKVLPSNDPSCIASQPLGKTCYELIPTDEVHYVPDSRDVLRYGTESDTRINSEDGAYVVHPPVGKWFIAAGMKIFGDKPFGWRFFGAVLGTFSVLLMYLLALRLWRSPWWAAAAGALLASDGLWFVQSRVAMLDIYMAVFVLAGVWLLVVDRDVTAPDHTGFRWWRIAAGAMFGLALATKWGALPFIAVGIAASIAWDAARQREALRHHMGPRALGAVGALVLLPVVIYVATYTPWFIDSHRYNPPLCQANTTTFSIAPFNLLKVGGVPGQWLCYQGQIYNFHKGLAKFDKNADTGKMQPGHPYYGYAWSWPWIGRPVAHYYASSGTGQNTVDSEVLGLPNPLIWWLGFLVALPLLVWWTYRRDATAALILGFFAAGWLPYLAGDIFGRAVFMFYATPLVPFVVLGVVHVLMRAVDRWPAVGPYAAGYVVACIGAFAYFYPILAALPIPYSGAFGWARHIWFGDRFRFGPIKSDCSAVDKIKLLCWI